MMDRLTLVMWMYLKMSALFSLALLPLLSPAAEGKLIFCNYSSFAQTRHEMGKFLPENINPHLCTHLIFAFVDISPDGRDLKPFNRNDQGHEGLYSRALALKDKNPKLKVLLAVGSWQIGSKPLIRDEQNRRIWIKNVVAYLRKHRFDGFDVDWEFPATKGNPPEDKYKFTLLMKGLYEAFAKEAAKTDQEKLLLTLATSSGNRYIDQSYEPDKIINYIDYMLLMTYNYLSQWEKQTGRHSGLFPLRDYLKTGKTAELYQQLSIDYWLNKGMPKDRLVVGIPSYGISVTLADPSQNGLRAPVISGGRMGDYLRETGILAHYESSSAAGHPIVHPAPQPAPKLTINVQSQTTSSPIPTGSGDDQKLRLKEIKKRPSWKKVQSAAAADVPEAEVITSSPVPVVTTPSMQHTTNEERKRPWVEWWTGPVWRKKAVTWRPWLSTSTRPSSSMRLHRRTNLRPRNIWKRKWAKKHANEISPDSKTGSELASHELQELSSARLGMGLQNAPFSTTMAPLWSTQTPESQTPVNATAVSDVRSLCQGLGVGTFPDPRSCIHFIICMPGNWQEQPPHVMACPPGTRFDANLKICNYASRVICDN